MEIKTIPVGAFRANCYLLIDNGNILVIDPGAGFKKINEKILEIPNHNVVGILLTHGHFDHIGAVDSLYKTYKCPVFASEDDEKMIRNEQYNNLGEYTATAKCPINWLTADNFSVGGFDIKVLYTPGHSNGSVMFIIDNNLFSGDTIFKLSVGRTDLYGGSDIKLYNSLQQLKYLDKDMIIYPGHDEITTVGFELANNPFLY